MRTQEKPTEQQLDTYRPLLQRHLLKAKRDLEQAGPSDDPGSSNFMPTAIIVSPDGEEAKLPMRFGDFHEKRILGLAVATTAKLVGAEAVILRMNATMAHMPPSLYGEGMSPEETDKISNDWLLKNTDGKGGVSNLPAHLRVDALCVNVIGPRAPQLGIMLEYRWVYKHIEYGKETEAPGYIQHMIPEWWKPTYRIALDGKSITCLRCDLTSHNANDVKAKYCGNCAEYHVFGD